MRSLPIVFALVGSAHADDALETRRRAESTTRWLAFDPPPPKLEGLGVTEDRDGTQLRIGATTLALDTAWWQNVDTAQQPLVDLEARGWRARVRLHRDLGWATLSVGAEVDEVDTRYGRGHYTTVDLALGRTFHLSRWMTAWISLGVALRQWSGTPPPGEVNDAIVQLTLGTTFR